MIDHLKKIQHKAVTLIEIAVPHPNNALIISCIEDATPSHLNIGISEEQLNKAWFDTLLEYLDLDQSNCVSKCEIASADALESPDYQDSDTKLLYCIKPGYYLSLCTQQFVLYYLDPPPDKNLIKNIKEAMDFANRLL